MRKIDGHKHLSQVYNVQISLFTSNWKVSDLKIWTMYGKYFKKHNLKPESKNKK